MKKTKGSVKKIGGANNPYAKAMKLSKGKVCDRSKLLKLVKAGKTPEEALALVCKGKAKKK